MKSFECVEVEVRASKGTMAAARKERRMSRRELGALMEEFTPLVRAIARRYEGRGAENEDLRQEGYLALVDIARSTNKRQLLKRLSRSLPGRVRDAAARMRAPAGVVSIHEETGEDGMELGDTITDVSVEREADAAELRAMIESRLDGGELELAEALRSGATYDEIAAREGVTRQAIAARVRRMREKLSGV